MITPLIVFLMMLAMSAAASSESQQATIVFIGNLESTRLIRQTGDAPVTCSSAGQCHIISNSCGTEEARLRITEVLAGPPLSEVTVTATVDEWCTPPVPPSHGPVLIWASRREARWVLVRVEILHIDHKGTRVIVPEEDGFIGAVPLSSVRRPLGVPILHSRVGDLPEQRIRALVQKGIVEVSGDAVNFRSAVSVEDLAHALRSNNRLERPGGAPAAQPGR